MRTINRGKKRFKAMAVGALVFSSLLYTATSAHAADWSMTAAGCVPETGGVILSANFGTAELPILPIDNARELICPVSGLGGGRLDANRLRVTFYDGDNRGQDCKITAVLLRSNLRLERGGELARFDSTESGDIFTEDGTNRKVGTVRLNANEFVDLDQNYYWVLLQLFRKGGATCNIAAVGVHLE